jgi:hypothetical protein
MDPRFGSLPTPATIVTEISAPIGELWLRNPAFVRWLQSIDIQVVSLRLFRSLPNCEYKLHVDVDPNLLQLGPWVRPVNTDKYVYDGLIKLNLVFHSHGSTMTWYDLHDGCNSHVNVNGNGYKSLSFEKQDCDVVYHTDCDTHCLVNGGRIHTLTNGQNNNSTRLCYSMMIQNKDHTLTWDRAVEMLTPWFDV